jgi:SAM-dependent methyltransferase
LIKFPCGDEGEVGMMHRRAPVAGERDTFIPALGIGWLTPLYDPLVGRLLGDARFKRRLVRRAGIRSGDRVLDVGCGTASLTIMLKQAYPDAEVIGLDADPRILRIARAKIERAGLDIALDQGLASELPYADGRVDRVVSSLVFHHLTTAQKRRTVGEILRVLRPGGKLHAADFGPPHNAPMRLVSAVIRHFEQVADNFDGLLPGMLRDAGFEDVRRTRGLATPFGSLVLYRAVKPESLAQPVPAC